MENITNAYHFISDLEKSTTILINWLIIANLICGFGIVTNIINIVVFLKMDLKDTVNISLFALAIADLASLVLLIGVVLCHNPLLLSLDQNIQFKEVEYLAFGWPRLCFTRTTSWITAFIACERCLCIIRPLTVKTIVTPRRTLIALAVIYFIMAASVTPTYYSTSLGWRFDPTGNRTVYGLNFRDNRQAIDGIFFILGVVITTGAFLCTAVCTLVLIVRLNESSKWAETFTVKSRLSEGVKNSKSNSRMIKSRQTCRMVCVISMAFIVCYAPTNILQLVMATVEEFNKGGKYENLNLVCWSISYVLEAFNSSINIFMYYIMSSKYRKALKHIFACSEACKTTTL